MKVNRLISLFIVVFMTSFFAHGQTLEQLINENKASLDIRVNQASFIARQPVTISIEMATNRWFTKGSDVDSLELFNAVVLPMEELAINGTKRVNGETWSTQTREITFYPMEPGIYQIPAIPVTFSVSADNSESITGTIETRSFEIKVTEPEALADIAQYVVTPELTLTVNGAFDAEHTYDRGDAVTISYQLAASQVPAMLLPDIKTPEINGISIYREPVKIDESRNRGELTSKKTISFTYIFERAGSYALDEQKLYWWNINNDSLEVITIPQNKWVVSSQIKENTGQDTSAFSLTNVSFDKLFYALLVLLIVYLIYQNKTALNAYWRTATQAERKERRASYQRAINEHKYHQAYQLLLRYLYQFYGLESDESILHFYQTNAPSNVETVKAFSKKVFNQTEDALDKTKLLSLTTIQVNKQKESVTLKKSPINLNR